MRSTGKRPVVRVLSSMRQMNLLGRSEHYFCSLSTAEEFTEPTQLAHSLQCRAEASWAAATETFPWTMPAVASCPHEATKVM
jgi:hypothetical protein